MAGINGLGMSGLTPPDRKNISGIKKEETSPTLGDNVTLGASPANGSSAIDTGKAIRALGAVSLEQPFSTEWGKTHLNGPGNLGGGFKTVGGETWGSASNVAPQDDAGHGTAPFHGFSISYPGQHETVFLSDGTLAPNSNDVLSHEQGYAMGEMDWNISK